MVIATALPTTRESIDKMSSDPRANAMSFTGAKVFCATKARERELLGEFITMWIRQNPQIEIVDTVVRQSSDAEFHCLSITVFYRGDGPS